MVTTRPKAGFTLIEAMLTVAIVGIVISLSATLMIQGNRYFQLTKARADLQKEARGIMYVITREVRQAQSNTIVISRSSNSQPYYSQITFTKQQGTAMVFFQNGNQLRQQWGNHTVTLSKNLQYLAFSFPRSDDMTIISVSMTLETLIYQGQQKALHMASEKVQVMD